LRLTPKEQMATSEDAKVHEDAPTTEAPPAKKKEKQPDFPGASPLENFVWHVPVCGGFCAPTANPSASFLKHFSNEWTPPQPCIRSRCFRGWMEHSVVARNVGKVGFALCEQRARPAHDNEEGVLCRHTDVSRKCLTGRGAILTLSCLVSLVAWAFTIFACAGLTSSRSVLSNTHWVRANVDDGSAKVYIGLSHVGVDRSNSGPGVSLPSYSQVRLDNTCGEGIAFVSKTYDDQLALMADSGDLFYDGDCARCKNAAEAAVSLAVSSAITQVFQMTTALQRTTRYGDLNCQKLFGIATGIYGFFSTLESLRGFRRNCGLQDDLPPWGRSTNVKVVVVDAAGNETEGKVDVKMLPGLAFTLLFVAVVLKAFDVFCHLIVPTPHPKHLHPEKGTPENEDLEAYLMIATTSEKEGGGATSVPDDGMKDRASSGIEMS